MTDLPPEGGERWSSLLGQGTAAEQLLVYGVAQQIIGVLLTPTLEFLQQELWKQEPAVPVSPQEAADMVLRGVMSQDEGASEALLSGTNGQRFADLVLNAGEPPGLQDVLLMFRRGFIPEGPAVPGQPSVAEAIKTSRIRNEWATAILQSAVVPISTSAAVDAVLRNQISQGDGETIGFENGIAPGDFDLLVNTSGNPPSLTELIELTRRGFIPEGNLDPATKVADPGEISFAQGIYEGDTKDKWLPYYAKLQEYIPPPRTVVALLRAGSISPAEGAALLQDAGLTPALADAYVAEATSSKTASAKNLNESTVVELYTLKLLPEADAVADLEALGYTAAESNLLLATAVSKQQLSALNKNVTKIGNYYIAAKIDQATAVTQLANLGVPADQATVLLQGWTIDRTANARILTPAQIATAWKYAVISQEDAMAKLEAYGYDPYDAWVLLGIAGLGPAPDQPPPGPPPNR